MGKYDDIIDQPHHISKKHPPMPVQQRAAQFSPFAALVGYDDCLYEEMRLTDEMLILEEDRKKELDYILSDISEDAVIAITYFVSDSTKDGGCYQIAVGQVSRIDRRRGIIILTDGSEIKIDYITDIEEQEPHQ